MFKLLFYPDYLRVIVLHIIVIDSIFCFHVFIAWYKGKETQVELTKSYSHMDVGFSIEPVSFTL